MFAARRAFERPVPFGVAIPVADQSKRNKPKNAMPTLILSPRYSDDSITLRRAAIALGWDVMRLASWRCPDDVEPVEPVLFAEPLFNAAVAEPLGLTVVEPPEDFLVRMPRQYVGRDVRL